MALKEKDYFKLLIWSLQALSVSCLTISPDFPEYNGDKFYYFGYGSNMLTKRIHIQNPSAIRLGVGELKNFRLDFNDYTERWDGAPATIVPTPDESVFGAVWEIDLENLANIDDQEGVHLGIYVAESVPVYLDNNNKIMARTYLLVQQPKRELKTFSKSDVPEIRQPSKTYLQCLVKGALETGLPAPYVNWLKAVKHNGRVAADLQELLELQDVELSEKLS